jgi:hypothetical protein
LILVLDLLGVDVRGWLSDLWASLRSIATATAYSLGQQLAVTAWNVAFAHVVVVWAFG